MYCGKIFTNLKYGLVIHVYYGMIIFHSALLRYALLNITLQQHQQHSMLGVHASALSIIHFGKIARKHGLTGVCLESLSR